MKSKYLPILILTCAFFSLQAQQSRDVCQFPAGSPLTTQDSIYLSNLPPLVMPPERRADPLPAVVDNSQLPFLRPVFEQYGSSCSQACLVGYNFTYEIDRMRNASADLLENQYATHFTYNFMNGGNGWLGASYFHSMEVLRLCGNMNCVDYGGTYFDDGTRWINGYEVYYNAMFNRIKGAYSINTSTVEGIEILKHWLFDHLEGSPDGGVASFYANTPWNVHILPNNSPEAGKHVMTNWYPSATHAMTIVGYNDSIRWDYNNDGQYTNDIDLNGDNILDARDWEIGGVKFVNSYGPAVLDSGFCYMMYKVLAETFENGGIWNQSVHVLDILENYEPLLTLKVTLKHNYREKVRVRAGVAADTAARYPDHIMDLPIFNFQGANHYMQGQGGAEYLKTIEFGLDVTPLISHTDPGQPARFFLLVDENDPNDEGTGELLGLSLYDYSGIPVEVICQDLPVPLEENGLTLASVVHEPGAGRPQVTNENLPPFSPGVPYSQQLTASGGAPPYSWELVGKYVVTTNSETYNPVVDHRILPDPGNDSIIPVPLAFDFPFFGEMYDTVYLHVNGYLQFRPDQLPYPYLEDQQLLLKGNRLIAPLTNDAFCLIQEDDDGAWYESDNQHYTFRWNLSWAKNPYVTAFDFSVTLFADGEIRFDYNHVSPDHYKWASGISNGDLKNYFFSPVQELDAFYSGMSIRFYPAQAPTGMSLSPQGLFSGIPADSSLIRDLLFRVTDNNSVSASRSLQWTAGPAIGFTLHAGNDEAFDYGDTVIMDVSVANRGSYPLQNCILTLDLADPFVQVLENSGFPGDLPPGESLQIDSCFVFIVDHETPDGHPLWLETTLQADQGQWQHCLPEQVIAPALTCSGLEVLDGNDGILSPGETAPVVIRMTNEGHSGLTGVTGLLTALDAAVQVVSGGYIGFGAVPAGCTARDTVVLHASDAAFSGCNARLRLQTASEEELFTDDSVSLQVGKKPVLVIDLDPRCHSGPVIFQTLQGMDIISDYKTMIPGNLKYYQSIFLCLGYNNSYHQLTWLEGKTLAGYLDNGGRMYMEGRLTWSGGILTPVHDKFLIATIGGNVLFEQVEGIAGTFAAGISMANNAAQPDWTYWLQPISPAFDILQDATYGHSCAVAHDGGIYRTIGSILEFGSLVDAETPSTKSELLLRFLNFFGIDYSLTQVNESANPPSYCSVTVYPNPARGQVTFSFQVADPGQEVSLEIFDIRGLKIKILIDRQHLPAGRHEMTWKGTIVSGNKFAGGIYLYKLTTGNCSASGKLILQY